MSGFIRSQFHRPGSEIPVNLDHCAYIERDDRMAHPRIFFAGANVFWAYYSEEDRDTDFRWITNLMLQTGSETSPTPDPEPIVVDPEDQESEPEPDSKPEVSPPIKGRR